MSPTSLPDLTATTPWHTDRDEAAGVIWVQPSTVAAVSLDPQPADWKQRMIDALRGLHDAAVVGAKRLNHDGRLFSMGEFVIHPKGFHHLGQGVLPVAYRFPEEVDAVAGGLLCVDAQLYDAVDGDTVMQSELGPLELCLALRQMGKRCIVVPQVVVTDNFSPAMDSPATEAFVQRWGFDWRAADLDALRQRDDAGGLIWNARFHAPSMPFDKYEQRPAVHWTNYRDVEVYRQRADHLIKVAAENAGDGPALDLGCGDGLFTHLLALQGIEAIGVDPEDIAIEQARQQVATQAYPNAVPTFQVGFGDKLPFEEHTFSLIILLDVIEHLPNPVAVLREMARVFKPGGAAVVSTPAWKYAGWSDPFYHVCEYTPDELARQVSVAGRMRIAHTGRIGGVYRDLIVVARAG